MAELEPKLGSPRSQSLSFDRNCCPPPHRAAGSRAVGDVHRLALHLISLVLFFFCLFSHRVLSFSCSPVRSR